MEQIKKYCIVKRIVAIIYTFLAATIVASPQEPALVDEFGKHNTEELMARLDNLHNQLYRNDGSIALIRVYREKADYLGFPSRYLARIKTYLTNHKVNGRRLAFQECDGGDETQYRLSFLGFRLRLHPRLYCRSPSVTGIRLFNYSI